MEIGNYELIFYILVNVLKTFAESELIIRMEIRDGSNKTVASRLVKTNKMFQIKTILGLNYFPWAIRRPRFLNLGLIFSLHCVKIFGKHIFANFM